MIQVIGGCFPQEPVDMSHSLSRIQAVLLGLVVLVGLGLAGVGLFGIGSQQRLWGSSFEVYTGFPNARGVEEGTRVRVQGKDAGEVVSVELAEDPGQNVRLKLRLGSEFARRLRADATAQILSEGLIGGRVIEIDPGQAADLLQPGALITARSSPELTDVLQHVNRTLEDISGGEGTLGKLIKDEEAYAQLLVLLQQGQETMASIKQDADALRRLPLVRSYVEDPHALLVRPNSERNRQVFEEGELFEPGRAVLTSAGKQKLDAVAPWLEGLKHNGSEVVVAAYADPKTSRPDLARTLTQQQSEAVCTYLKDRHNAHKLGWWSTRKVTSLGCGTNPPPQPEAMPLPPARIEVVVFVPQS
jgi:phospholipid/cholesterol/gamma-HCH transport system substrate-binding protein